MTEKVKNGEKLRKHEPWRHLMIFDNLIWKLTQGWQNIKTLT